MKADDLDSGSKPPITSWYGKRIPHSELLLLVLAVCICACFYAVYDFPANRLQFEDEVVRAFPQGDKIRFVGVYDFGMERTYPPLTYHELGFPTQSNSELPPPTNVVVEADQKPIAFKILSEGLSFRLPVDAVGGTRLRIEYTLAAPKHRATYITRTANLWSKPILEARFMIPPGVKSNYHHGESVEVAFKNFRPHEDWKIEW